MKNVYTIKRLSEKIRKRVTYKYYAYFVIFFKLIYKFNISGFN